MTNTLTKLKAFAEWMNSGVWNKDVDVPTVYSFGQCATSAMMSQWSTTRQHGDKRLRASQLGKPAILQAMDSLGLPKQGETVVNKLKQIFFQGEMYECFVLEMLRLYGFEVTGLQQEVVFKGIRGHLDAILDNSLLIEVKTMSPQYAPKFRRNPDDSRGYITQLAIYQETTGLPGAWITFDKGTSETHVVEYPNGSIKEDALERARQIIEVMPTIKTFEDVFNQFSPPEPEPYVCRKQPTELFTVPETMKYSVWRHLFYKIETQPDCYKKPREFVTDYTTLDEAKEVLNKLLNV